MTSPSMVTLGDKWPVKSGGIGEPLPLVRRLGQCDVQGGGILQQKEEEMLSVIIFSSLSCSIFRCISSQGCCLHSLPAPFTTLSTYTIQHYMNETLFIFIDDFRPTFLIHLHEWMTIKRTGLKPSYYC